MPKETTRLSSLARILRSLKMEHFVRSEFEVFLSGSFNVSPLSRIYERHVGRIPTSFPVQGTLFSSTTRSAPLFFDRCIPIVTPIYRRGEEPEFLRFPIFSCFTK